MNHVIILLSIVFVSTIAMVATFYFGRKSEEASTKKYMSEQNDMRRALKAMVRHGQDKTNSKKYMLMVCFKNAHKRLNCPGNYRAFKEVQFNQ